MFSFKRIPRRLSILFVAVSLAAVVTGFAIGDAKKDPLVVTMEAMMDRYQALVRQTPDCTTGSVRRYIPASEPSYNKFYNDLLAFKSEIEKETFSRAHLESDDPKITILGPVIAVYSQLQVGMLTNYFMQAHRDPKGVGNYFPDAMDVLNLKISTKAGTTLLDNGKYGLRDSIRHVSDGRGSHLMVEVFLNPAMIIGAEIVALQYPANKIDYAKLILASMLQQTIVNRWSLNRMIKTAVSEIGYEKYYTKIHSCAKDLISFRMNNIKITEGNFYKSLRQEDRYNDFLDVLPRIAEGLKGRPVLGQTLTARAMREFISNSKPVQDHIEVMNIDRKLNDTQIDSLHTPQLIVYENGQMEMDQDGEEKILGKTVKYTMAARSKQLISEHVYPADDLSPEFLSKRLAFHAFEERRILLSDGILKRLKEELGTELKFVSKKQQVVVFDDIQKGIDEVEENLKKKQDADAGVDESTVSLPVAPVDCTGPDCGVGQVLGATSAPEVASTNADRELFEKQKASQKKLLTYLESNEAKTRALKVVSRISEENKTAWLEGQSKTLAGVIAAEFSLQKSHNKNLNRLAQYSENLKEPAQEGVNALQNQEKIKAFIKEKMTKTCAASTMNDKSGLERCTKEQNSEAFLGGNDKNNFWAYIGENPNRLSWKKYNAYFEKIERSTLSALAMTAAEHRKIVKPTYPITPDEVSMLFGLKLQRSKTLRSGSEKKYFSGYTPTPESEESKQLKKIAQSKIALKFMKRFFAKLSESFNKIVKDQNISPVTEENTPLKYLMASVGKEVYKDFMTAVTTPPGSRKIASPLLGDGLAIYKSFKPLFMPAVDHTYVRKSAEAMMAMACQQKELDSLKKESASEKKGIDGALDVNPADAQSDPNDYQADPKKLNDVLDAFRNALALIGTYKEATAGRLMEYTSPPNLVDSIGWYANAVDLLDQQMPGLLPHERMAASIWDQLLMSEIKIASVQAEMPILGAELKSTNYTDEKNTFLYALQEEYKDRPLAGADFQNTISKFSYKALERDHGKVEEFCNVDVNDRKDNEAFMHMFQSSSALREALSLGNSRLKRFDKQLKEDTKTWTERTIDVVNKWLIGGVIAIGVLFALSGLGALPASWMIAMGMLTPEAAALAGMWGLSAPGAWVAGTIWLNLTTNYLAMFVVGSSYTGLASRAYFYEQPRQLRFVGEVANSQFGIMGTPTVSRADLIARRQELHMNQVFTGAGIVLDLTFIKIFTIPEVKRLMGITGRKAIMDMTKDNPVMRRMLLRQSYNELIETHGFRKGFPIYLERFKPWLKNKRANVMNPVLATEEAILDGAAITLSKQIPQADDLLKSHIRHRDQLIDQAEQYVTKYGKVVEFIEGNATIRQRAWQYWLNVKRKYGWRGRFWRVIREKNKNQVQAELDFAREMTDDGKLTTAVLRAYELQSKHQQIVQEVMREEQAIAVLTQIKETVGSASDIFPPTYHYFQRMSKDEMMREKAHIVYMKKQFGDDTFAKATQQTFKDLAYMLQDLSDLSPETVALLLKHGVTALRQDATEQMVVIGKQNVTQHLDAEGRLPRTADGEIIKEFDDAYTEFKVLPPALAKDWLKRVAASSGKEYIYDAFLVDSKAILDGVSAGWTMKQSAQKLAQMAKRAGLHKKFVNPVVNAVTAEEQHLIALMKQLEAQQVNHAIKSGTTENQ